MTNELSSTNIIQNSWKSMYDLLNDNLTDPASRTDTRWIFPEHPARKTFPGYPIVTFMVDTDTTQFEFKDGRAITISYMFTVFADKSEYADSVADDIISTINANQSTLEGKNLYLPRVT